MILLAPVGIVVVVTGGGGSGSGGKSYSNEHVVFCSCGSCSSSSDQQLAMVLLSSSLFVLLVSPISVCCCLTLVEAMEMVDVTVVAGIAWHCCSLDDCRGESLNCKMVHAVVVLVVCLLWNLLVWMIDEWTSNTVGMDVGRSERDAGSLCHQWCVVGQMKWQWCLLCCCSCCCCWWKKAERIWFQVEANDFFSENAQKIV